MVAVISPSLHAPHLYSVTSLHPLKGGCDVCDASVIVTGVANVTLVTVVTPNRFLGLRSRNSPLGILFKQSKNSGGRGK
jgi:hypothetical protein